MNASSSDLTVEVKDAKGPIYSDGGHVYCSTCGRVIYSLYRYGPMTPREHNKVFCVCNGKETGEVKQRVTTYYPKDLKENGASES